MLIAVFKIGLLKYNKSQITVCRTNEVILSFYKNERITE